MTLRQLLTVLLLASSAFGSLYCTNPIASTTLDAGRSAQVTWIDDKTSPSLDALGHCSIELWHGNSSLVATLTTDVDPVTLSVKVWISPSLGVNDTNYYMRFVWANPPLTVYTSPFTITGTAFVPNALSEPVETAVGANVAAANQTTMPLIRIPPVTAPTSSSTAISGFLTTTSPASIPRPPSTSSPVGSSPSDNPLLNSKTGSGGSLWRRTPVDLERVKFRLVFILWPALIGITLAL